MGNKVQLGFSFSFSMLNRKLTAAYIRRVTALHWILFQNDILVKVNKEYGVFLVVELTCLSGKFNSP